MPRKKKQPAKPHPTPETAVTLTDWMQVGFDRFGPLTEAYKAISGDATYPTQACPIGCAVLSRNPFAAELDTPDFWPEAKRQFPQLGKQLWLTPTTCPELFKDPATNRVDRTLEGRSVLLHYLIVWLNDILKLPRDRTVAILEGLGY